MKSLWCSKKNTIIELMKDPEKFNNALIPCEGPECNHWMDGHCLHINERAYNPGEKDVTGGHHI